MKQADNAHLLKTAKDHPAKAAVLHPGMDMFGVAAPFVDGGALCAVHAGAPLLQALRLGGAVALWRPPCGPVAG
jgi:hypothetical protein